MFNSSLKAYLNLLFVILTFTMACGMPGSIVADEKVSIAQYYGFKPLEIFKLSARSSNMLSEDMNHDGKKDLILIDNSNSRIDVLQQKSDQDKKYQDPRSKEVNFIPNDSRFKHIKVPVDVSISALTVGDFNGDGRNDLAYLAIPDRLIIRYQSESGDWTNRKRIRLAELQPTQWTIAAGDLNHDQKTDLIVLGKNHTYVILQNQKGDLNSPKQILNTSPKLGLATVADVDGDGRNDFTYATRDGKNQILCTRLQKTDGNLGPEIRFELSNPRSVTLANIDGKPGHEILTIDSQTSRLKVQQLENPQSQNGELSKRLTMYGFGEEGRRPQSRV